MTPEKPAQAYKTIKWLEGEFRETAPTPVSSSEVPGPGRSCTSELHTGGFLHCFISGRNSWV